MELKIQTHSSVEAKQVVDRLTSENVENKIWSYLKKFDLHSDVEWLVDMKVKTTDKWYNWVLQINIDWKLFRYEREDYKKLDDLVNHLFDHFKEELSSK